MSATLMLDEKLLLVSGSPGEAAEAVVERLLVAQYQPGESSDHFCLDGSQRAELLAARAGCSRSVSLAHLARFCAQKCQAMINKKQMRDLMNLYSGLVERCFTACSNDFTSKVLSSKEDECLRNCADKFLNHSNRVGLRFSEMNAENMSKGLGPTSGR